MKCLAYAGAWKRMEELGKTTSVIRLAGSSGGAIMAAAVAVGYSAEEIGQVLRETDMNQFKDGSWTLLGKVWDLVYNLGIYKGDAMDSWLGRLLAVKTGDPDITFEQLQDKYGKELIVTGSNLNKRSLELYSPTWTPQMPVRRAVRISMSIPLFFQPVKMETHQGTALLVDGGLMANYIIDVFRSNGSSGGDVLEETLGFKLLGSGEREDADIYHGFDKLDSVTKVVKAVVNSMMLQMERLYIKKNYWKQTVAIPTHGVSATDFGLSDDVKEQLYRWGYEATDQYFAAE